MVVGVFATQVITDYADKFIAVIIVTLVVSAMPKNYKLSFNQRMNRQNG